MHAAANAHLYLWVPNALVPEGLTVMKVLGFQLQEQPRLVQNPQGWRPGWSRGWVLILAGKCLSGLGTSCRGSSPGIVHQNLSPQLSLDDVYARLPFFEQLFPGNRHIRDKIRQQLQVLRDDGLLIFRGSGEYALNLQFSELTAEPPTPLPSGSVTPPERQVLCTVALPRYASCD